MRSSAKNAWWLKFVGVVSVSLLAGCSNPERVVHHLENSDVETGSTSPDQWISFDGSGKYDMEWTDEESVSGEKSLSISTETPQSTDFAYWAQSIKTDIPHWQSVTLKVCIKGNLSGKGVSILIRGDDAIGGSGAEQFATTEQTTPITGSFEWSDFSVTLDQVGQNTQGLTVCLVYLPETTGEVYFDDIRLFHSK